MRRAIPVHLVSMLANHFIGTYPYTSVDPVAGDYLEVGNSIYRVHKIYRNCGDEDGLTRICVRRLRPWE